MIFPHNGWTVKIIGIMMLYRNFGDNFVFSVFLTQKSSSYFTFWFLWVFWVFLSFFPINQKNCACLVYRYHQSTQQFIFDIQPHSCFGMNNQTHLIPGTLTILFCCCCFFKITKNVRANPLIHHSQWLFLMENVHKLPVLPLINHFKLIHANLRRSFLALPFGQFDVESNFCNHFGFYDQFCCFFSFLFLSFVCFIFVTVLDNCNQ